MVTGVEGRGAVPPCRVPRALLLRGTGAHAGGGPGMAVVCHERDSAFMALVYRFCAALRTCGIILSAILAMCGLCEAPAPRP